MSAAHQLLGKSLHSFFFGGGEVEYLLLPRTLVLHFCCCLDLQAQGQAVAVFYNQDAFATVCQKYEGIFIKYVMVA